MLDAENIARLLQTTVTPILAISGLGLFILVVQTRFVAITDIIRELNRERLELTRRRALGELRGAEVGWVEARMGNLQRQITILERRGSLVKDALQYIFTAIFLFVIASLIMLAEQAFEAGLSAIVLVLFVLGLGMLFLTCVNLVREVRTSYDALELDLAMEPYDRFLEGA